MTTVATARSKHVIATMRQLTEAEPEGALSKLKIVPAYWIGKPFMEGNSFGTSRHQQR